jgi:hypothetical protein
VLAKELSGAPWQLTGLGMPQNSSALSSAGINLFGTDFFYQSVSNEQCLAAAFDWGYTTAAGVMGLSWSFGRQTASSSTSFRAACYLGD